MPTEPIYPEPQHFPESHDPDDTGSTPSSVAVVPTPSQTQPMYPPPQEAMPHVEHSYSPATFVCVRCGSTNIAKGYVVDYGDKFEQVHFAPKRITLNWLNSLFNLRPWRGLAKLNAEACRDCGAVLLVVEPEELRRAERRHE